MANYNIVIDNGIFKPFDYSLALNAIKEYNTGYEKQLAVYDKIALTLGDLASAVEGTEKAKSIYDTYLDRFNQAADSFSRGMNVNNARELGVLRKLYGTQIRQLERANEAMVKEAERRRAEKDPTMMYLDIGNLDNYMDDPNRVLGKYSASLLTNDVASIAKAIGNSLVSKENADRLDPYTRVWIQKKGFKKEDIDKAIQEVYTGGIDSVSDPIYKNILQNAMLASGVYNWADESTKARAERAAARGLYGGIGESTMGTYEDKENIANLHLRNQIELENIKARNELNKKLIEGLLTGTSGKNGGSALGTIPINTFDEVSPNYGLENTLKLLRTLLNTLGIREGNDGKYYYSKAPVKVLTTNKTTYGPMYSSKTIDADLYRNGKLLSKEEFVKQGKNNFIKKELENYYDNNVIPSLISIGISPRANITGKDVENAYKAAIKDTGAISAGFMEVLNGKNARESLDNIITKLKNGDELPAGTIRRVKAWNKNGDLSLDTLDIKASELLVDENPIFYTHIGKPLVQKDQKRSDLALNLIFKLNGKFYAIPKSNLGSITEDSYTLGDLYSLIANTKDRSIKLKAAEIKQKYLEAGINISDEQALQLGANEYKTSLENAAAAYLRSIGTALTLEYGNPTFNFTSTSNSAQP